MINLVRNALKFTAKGSIDIRACYWPDPYNFLVIHIRDSGVGIAQEDLSKLFTRFGKLQRTASLNDDGIGLGLTIVKKIVESCNGSVEAHSDGLGKGSLFRVLLRLNQYYELPGDELSSDNKHPILDVS